MDSDNVDPEIQHKMIEKANHQENPFAPIVDLYGVYKKDDLEVKFKCFTKKNIEKSLVKWAFKLTEKNVSSYYNSCALGWTPKVKSNDMNKNWARYLIGYNNENKPIAFSLFRFDFDYGRSCLYCYELQVEQESQRKGLGEFMMSALERMAKIWSMERLVLTILTNNDGAMRFYKRLGYVLDETSPDKSDEPSYEILSKEF